MVDFQSANSLVCHIFDSADRICGLTNLCSLEKGHEIDPLANNDIRAGFEPIQPSCDRFERKIPKRVP